MEWMNALNLSSEEIVTPDDAGAAEPMPVEVSAREVESGRVDLQGIDWRGLPISRDRFHELRLGSYVNYTNTAVSRDVLAHQIFSPRLDGYFYQFHHTSLQNKCSVVHIQLRNLVWATSKNDVFYTNPYGVAHWCPISKSTSMALDLSQHDIGGMMISCMVARHGILMVGGFFGEYLFRRIGDDEDAFETQHKTPPAAHVLGSHVHKGTLTLDPRGSTNHMEIVYGRSSNGPQAIISSNDDSVRLMDITTREIKKTLTFEKPVNCTTQSPDKRMLCVVGDFENTLIVDSEGGKHLATLTGHTDYSFACAWSPCGRLLATGNQDLTTRIYDTRNFAKTLAVLPATMGAIRSLRFSDDAAILAIAESVDYVNLVDVSAPLPPADYQSTPPPPPSSTLTSKCALDDLHPDRLRTQVVDFFGEVAGISFAPGDAGDDAFFIGISDPKYGSVLELHRDRRSSKYRTTGSSVRTDSLWL
ncbi:WD40-repeat-containing domain protein [Powellomyces hirtus]|nr:WD40-repeat-containing domain protein [Powellomyces hirtus]